MSQPSGPQTVRPPVALGCFLSLAVLAAMAGAIAFAVVFLESGADTGRVKVESADAYAPGSVAFIGEENLYLVRLEGGDFLALADMDAANQGRRCRVSLVPVDDPGLPVDSATLEARMSAEAAGATSVFFEPCLGSVYDIAGVRLTGPGANLDRYPASLDSSGRVVIETGERQCSRRTTGNTSAPATC